MSTDIQLGWLGAVYERKAVAETDWDGTGLTLRTRREIGFVPLDPCVSADLLDSPGSCKQWRSLL
jgi:hypothetical protein